MTMRGICGTLAALAMMGCSRTELDGANHERFGSTQPSSPFFKVGYRDLAMDESPRIWHSRDGSIEAFPAAGAFTYDGQWMLVAQSPAPNPQDHIAWLDVHGQTIRSQSLPHSIEFARPRADAGRAAIVMWPDAVHAELGTLDADGSYHALVTGHFIAPPTYAPDGQTIVFTESVNNNGSQCLLETMRDDGSSRTTLVTAPGVMQGSFSYDQKRLAYSVLTVSTYEMAVLDMQSLTSEIVLADSGADRYWPTFTPDGSGIVFVEYDHVANTGTIRLLDLTTKEVTTLLDAGNNISWVSYGLSVADD